MSENVDDENDDDGHVQIPDQFEGNPAHDAQLEMIILVLGEDQGSGRSQNLLQNQLLRRDQNHILDQFPN
jgi:hypothetical protein